MQAVLGAGMFSILSRAAFHFRTSLFLNARYVGVVDVSFALLQDFSWLSFLLHIRKPLAAMWAQAPGMTNVSARHGQDMRIAI